VKIERKQVLGSLLLAIFVLIFIFMRARHLFWR